MNPWEIAAWIVAAAASIVAAIKAGRLKAARQEIGVYQRVIAGLEEFQSLKLSLVWNPAINRWQVADPHLKVNQFDANSQARILATEEHWIMAVQNSVKKKRSIMETQRAGATAAAAEQNPPQIHGISARGIQ